MDSKNLTFQDREYMQETPAQTKEKFGFTEFDAKEIKSSYEMAGIHENEFRQFDETTGMMKDATRSSNMSEEDYSLGKTRTKAMNNMKMTHHSMLDLKQDIKNAGHMSGEMRDICKGIDRITAQIDRSVNCRVESNGRFMLDLAKYRAYIGDVVGAYDYSIEKAVYYLENKTPKTVRGKERFEFVRRLLSYMRREREAFSANAQIKEREMNAEHASHVNGGNILLDIRADVAREVENDGRGATKSAQTFTRDNRKYYFKEEREVEAGGIDYVESAQSCLYNLRQIPDHLKTKSDNLKQRTAEVIFELRYLFKDYIHILNALLNDFMESKINYEYFGESIHDQMVDWGVSEDTATEYVSELKEKLEKDNTEPEICEQAFQQVLNYNYADALAATNGIEDGRRLAGRNVATSRVSELLGCRDCIADSKTVLFSDEKGALKSGISMEEVKGHTLLHLIKKYRRIEFTGKAKRMICDLQFVDFICGQMDRHIGNYIVNGAARNGVFYIDTIVGIDNDMSFGNLTYKDLKLGRNRLAGTESGDPFAMRKISRDLYMKIMDTRPEVLIYALADLGLSAKEQDALTNRLIGMQSYLRRAYEHFGDDLLVENDNDWENLSAANIYAGKKSFERYDGTQMYQSIWGGIITNLRDYHVASHSI